MIVELEKCAALALAVDHARKKRDALFNAAGECGLRPLGDAGVAKARWLSVIMVIVVMIRSSVIA